MMPKDLKELLRAFNDHAVKYVISKDDLIQNKLASGREQDILDVKKLRAATG